MNKYDPSKWQPRIDSIIKMAGYAPESAKELLHLLCEDINDQRVKYTQTKEDQENKNMMELKKTGKSNAFPWPRSKL